MAEVRAFRGVMYGGELDSTIGQLIAPPYDVTYPHLIARLRDRHPNNMVHLEHVEPDPGADPHLHAAALYRAWLRQGVLERDDQRALYRYDHVFTANGSRRTRSGILAAVRLASWPECVVLPHEATFPGPRIERQRRLRAVQANLSPLYFLCRDTEGELGNLLASSARQPPDVADTDPDGEEHRVTRLTGYETLGRFERFFADRRLYVADGHHRYEAALAYRDERRPPGAPSDHPDPDGPGAERFVLALICAADDPGVLVLPTHRLVRGLPSFDPAELRSRLSGYFALDPVVGTDAGRLDDAAVAGLTADPGVVCLMRFAGEATIWRLRAGENSKHESLMPNDRTAAWRGLNVAILGSAVIEGVLGVTPDQLLNRVTFAHDAAGAQAAVDQGQTQIAFFVRASTVDALMAIADAGEIMPPKSTYFWPKVPAGLVIHDLTMI